MAATEIVFKVRGYKDGTFYDVWLIEQVAEGASWCLMHGEVGPARLDRLVAWFESLGVRVEREESPYAARRLIPVERRKRRLTGE